MKVIYQLVGSDHTTTLLENCVNKIYSYQTDWLKFFLQDYHAYKYINVKLRNLLTDDLILQTMIDSTNKYDPLPLFKIQVSDYGGLEHNVEYGLSVWMNGTIFHFKFMIKK